nr:Sua5/YciO/YrdC/YwlC family protein [Saprospiraceae bacterium]
AILQAILAQLSLPLITTSVKQNVDEDWDTYYVDPYDLRMDYEHVVDFMVDGGPGNAEASTVLDCTGDAIQVIRQGIGVLDL